jgi:hypothetical protein
VDSGFSRRKNNRHKDAGAAWRLPKPCASVLTFVRCYRVTIKTVKKKLTISSLGLVVFAGLAYFVVIRHWFSETPRQVTDPDFIMLENILSPNQQHRILIYHYDTGSFGCSRAWWAVTPNSFQDIDLTEYELPDGYMTKGWSEQNEILVEKWEPYYYRQKLGELKTDDIFQGVKVKLIEAPNTKTGKDSGINPTPEISPAKGT